jgi:hypothetical protein
VSAPYRPGQQQWPGNGPQRPERPPPIQFRQGEPPRPPDRPALRWTLRIAGLVAIAVVSGLLWSVITSDDAAPAASGQGTEEPPSEGAFDLKPHPDMRDPQFDENCAAHAYGDIQQFLQANTCDHLSRQLFVAEIEGRRVFTSVSVVTMPTEEKAAELRDLTDKDGSGNVSDVVRDDVVKINGLDKLSSGGGYASKQSGRDVIIVEADLGPGDRGSDKTKDEKEILDPVCEDALRLGPEIADDTGG